MKDLSCDPAAFSLMERDELIVAVITRALEDPDETALRTVAESVRDVIAIDLSVKTGQVH